MMFVYLSKLLPLFVYPLGLACVLIMIALFSPKRQKWQRALLIIVLVLLLLSSNRWVSLTLARSLEWRYLPPAETPQAEVIVLLGGGTESGDAPRPMTEVNGAGDRVIYAAKLYQEGAAPNILVSGGNLEFSEARGDTPASEMTDLLTLIGVPKAAIWLQPQSQNTYEDAVYTAEILAEAGIDKIILVTSALHMPRSVALFEKQGLTVIPAPVDYTVTQKNWESAFSPNVQEVILNLLPNASALGLTTSVLKEVLGMLVYGARGWL